MVDTTIVVLAILQLELQHPECQIAVLVPRLVVKHWWQTPLYNRRAQLLKLLLLVRGNLSALHLKASATALAAQPPSPSPPREAPRRPRRT